MKKFSLLIFLLFILISPNTVYALDEKFYSTISFSINELETERVQPYRTPNKISGEYTKDIISNTSIEDLTNDDLDSRIYNKYERVTVRPLSTVDVGYYWYNNTQDELDIDTIRIPLSRQTVYRGDITEVLPDLPFKWGITYAESLKKGGNYLDVEGIGLVSPNSRGAVIIETFTVPVPIEITDYEIEYMNETMSKITFRVRSLVSQYLDNVLINYAGNIDIRINFTSYEEFTLTVYKECDLEGNKVNCGPMRIKDPNLKTACMIYGSTWSGYIHPDSITVFNNIGDSWIAGSGVQPDRGSFCITKLPYMYTTDDMIGYVDHSEVSDDVYWKNLLDIDVLPITSYSENIFDRFLGLIKHNIVDNLKVI